MSAPGAGARPSLRLEAAVAWLGAHRLLEERLFELLGRWSKEVSEPEAKMLLAAHSLRHAWHSELWAGRMPSLPAPQAITSLAGPSEPAGLALSPARVEGIVCSLREVGAEGTLEKLAAVYRVVVPRLVVSYEVHLEGASEVSDGPVIRALRLAIFDEGESWREGERLLQVLVLGREESERAARAQGALEAVIAGSPGFAGPAR